MKRFSPRCYPRFSLFWILIFWRTRHEMYCFSASFLLAFFSRFVFSSINQLTQIWNWKDLKFCVACYPTIINNYFISRNWKLRLISFTKTLFIPVKYKQISLIPRQKKPKVARCWHNKVIQVSVSEKTGQNQKSHVTFSIKTIRKDHKPWHLPR